MKTIGAMTVLTVDIVILPDNQTAGRVLNFKVLHSGSRLFKRCPINCRANKLARLGTTIRLSDMFCHCGYPLRNMWSHLLAVFSSRILSTLYGWLKHEQNGAQALDKARWEAYWSTLVKHDDWKVLGKRFLQKLQKLGREGNTTLPTYYKRSLLLEKEEVLRHLHLQGLSWAVWSCYRQAKLIHWELPMVPTKKGITKGLFRPKCVFGQVYWRGINVALPTSLSIHL